MNNDMLAVVLDTVKRHLESNAPTPFLIEFVERAIENSEGKSPERYELLKLWQQMTAVEGE